MNESYTDIPSEQRMIMIYGGTTPLAALEIPWEYQSYITSFPIFFRVILNSHTLYDIIAKVFVLFVYVGMS